MTATVGFFALSHFRTGKPVPTLGSVLEGKLFLKMLYAQSRSFSSPL
jgi:hypothetical protein